MNECIQYLQYELREESLGVFRRLWMLLMPYLDLTSWKERRYHIISQHFSVSRRISLSWVFFIFPYVEYLLCVMSDCNWNFWSSPLFSLKFNWKILHTAILLRNSLNWQEIFFFIKYALHCQENVLSLQLQWTFFFQYTTREIIFVIYP